MKAQNDKSAEFLYGTAIGRAVLKAMLFFKLPEHLGNFLRSPKSKLYIKHFIKKNRIDMSAFKDIEFNSFNDFFTREKTISYDAEADHFISPADSFLSVYDISEDSAFHIKGNDYTLADFFGLDNETANDKLKRIIQRYSGGKCLVFRLCASDYHHYCYVDDGFQAENHFIEGTLYSVQPVALKNFKVFTRNRRAWTILETKNFGSVAQIEIGAFSVGGIINKHENYIFSKGSEKGYFDLHGSTIVLLLEKDRVEILPEIQEALKSESEYKVTIGQQIGNRFEQISAGEEGE